MRPKERRESGQNDLFRSRLDQILNLDHALVKLARWIENPYYQFFCGEEFFQHRLPFERSSLTRWRQRMGEDKLTALVQESLATAVRLEAARPADFTAVIVDTTVQEKAIAFPTDAKLMHRARERLVKLAHRHGVKLRQSSARVGKFTLIKHQRYAHAKQFKRANKALKRLRTMLGAVIRDITRKLDDRPDLAGFFQLALSLARRVKDQRQRERGKKIYSLHAPEVECIGKGKPQEMTPLGRPGQPAELASIYVQLAAEDASFATGQIYGAAGGSGQP